MRYQVCEITEGTLRHFYLNPKGKPRMSKNRATMLTHETAMEVLAAYPHRDLFIQAEHDCHFREIDSEGLIETKKLYTLESKTNPDDKFAKYMTERQAREAIRDGYTIMEVL